MNDESKIDPRYDPAFQRGYTGAVGTGSHPHGVSRASRRAATEPTAPPAPSGNSPRPDPGASPAQYPDADLLRDAATFDAFNDEESLVEVLEPRRPSRNPFLISLAIVGVALIVAGVSWMISARSTMSNGGSLASEFDYWFVQSAIFGAPVTIVAGVGIIAGVLFVFANAWNRGH